MNLPGEDPVPEESPLNLILYMHLRIFAYLSNDLMVSFDPMDSMLASGTCPGIAALPLELGGVTRIDCSSLFWPE